MLLEREVQFSTQLNLIVLYGFDKNDKSLVVGDRLIDALKSPRYENEYNYIIIFIY
jgi:hypothetical protein